MKDIIKKINWLKDQRLIGRFKVNDKSEDNDLSTILNQIRIALESTQSTNPEKEMSAKEFLRKKFNIEFPKTLISKLGDKIPINEVETWMEEYSFASTPIEENNLIKEIEKYSDKYQFSFQFWGSGNNTIYIMKDDVDLYDTGGHSTIKDVIVDALHYIYRINRVPNVKRIC